MLGSSVYSAILLYTFVCCILCRYKHIVTLSNFYETRQTAGRGEVNEKNMTNTYNDAGLVRSGRCSSLIRNQYSTQVRRHTNRTPKIKVWTAQGTVMDALLASLTILSNRDGTPQKKGAPSATQTHQSGNLLMQVCPDASWRVIPY